MEIDSTDENGDNFSLSVCIRAAQTILWNPTDKLSKQRRERKENLRGNYRICNRLCERQKSADFFSVDFCRSTVSVETEIERLHSALV